MNPAVNSAVNPAWNSALSEFLLGAMHDSTVAKTYWENAREGEQEKMIAPSYYTGRPRRGASRHLVERPGDQENLGVLSLPSSAARVVAQ